MDPTTRRRALATGAAALAGLAGCGALGGGGGDGGDDDTVEMTNENRFVPATLSVPTGTTVTFENVGSIGHSVTAYAADLPEGADYWASGGFDSEEAARSEYPDGGRIDGGETYEHTFETAGTHDYFCIPHERVGMKGTVEVG